MVTMVVEFGGAAWPEEIGKNRWVTLCRYDVIKQNKALNGREALAEEPARNSSAKENTISDAREWA